MAKIEGEEDQDFYQTNRPTDKTTQTDTSQAKQKEQGTKGAKTTQVRSDTLGAKNHT